MISRSVCERYFTWIDVNGAHESGQQVRPVKNSRDASCAVFRHVRRRTRRCSNLRSKNGSCLAFFRSGGHGWKFPLEFATCSRHCFHLVLPRRFRTAKHLYCNGWLGLTSKRAKIRAHFTRNKKRLGRSVQQMVAPLNLPSFNGEPSLLVTDPIEALA